MAFQWDKGGSAFATLDDFDGARKLMAEWLRDDQNGQEFADTFSTPESVDQLTRVLELHGLAVSSTNLSWCFQRLRDSGQLVAPQPDIEPEVRTDRNGKPLTESQIAWGEMVLWSNRASSAQIQQRRQSEPAYREFYRTNLRSEMDQPIDGAVVPESSKPVGRARYTDDAEMDRLIKFAKDFNALPSADAKKCFLPGYNRQHAQYSQDFEQCVRLQLL